MTTKLVRIFKEDYDRLKEERDHFDLSIAELVHIHLTWYKKHHKEELSERLER
ncbi:hypothetical protein ES703_116364 [subsurface metagenome]